ncbi:MAG: ATP-binding cassette domain-containing protein, partial [Stackebrandtia sp.]
MSETARMTARGLVKRYGHVTAVDGADFDLRAGEVLAVIGDNGAGKSTLIKALSGAIAPDAGEITLDGQPVRFRTPADARAHGIETVYQDLALAPALDIATNMFMGRELRRRGPLGNVLRLLDKKRMRDEAAAHMSELQIGLQSINVAVENLSGGQRQGVAVARAAAWARHVVIMDEPTAALGVKESAQVLDLIGRVRDRHGCAVLMISHDLHVVMSATDRVVCLNAHVC